MSITLEGIRSVNQRIQKIKIKGKDYATVAARVQAFRELCPDGLIHAEIISINDGVVLMQAQVKDENGKLLATGYAQEKENASMINKTSYVENCETSAVGRALAMLGLGSEEDIASSQEVDAARVQQEQIEKEQLQQEIADSKLRMAVMRHINAHKPPEKIKELKNRVGGDLVNMTTKHCQSYMKENHLLWDGEALHESEGQDSQHTADVSTAENAGNRRG